MVTAIIQGKIRILNHRIYRNLYVFSLLNKKISLIEILLKDRDTLIEQSVLQIIKILYTNLFEYKLR